VTFRPLAERRPRFPAELVAYHAPGQAASAPYRELLTALLATAPAGIAQPALLFTAAAPGLGSTTALLNVAITAAQQGRRVVVVDANLRAPAIAERLGLDGAPGLREALAGAVALDRAVQPTELAGLQALTAGAPAGPAPLTAAIGALLRQLRERADLVLVDGPPWDGRADVVVLGAACDAAYLVAQEAEADGPRVKELLRAVAEQGARLAGCVLTAR
jgi:non-specific protein-tyrosine kinase